MIQYGTRILTVLGLIPWIVFYFTIIGASIITATGENTDMDINSISNALPYFVIIMLLLIFLPALWEFRWKRYGPYFGSIARSMIPVHAVTLLLLCLVLLPTFAGIEQYWISRDKLLFYPGHQLGYSFTPREATVVEHLRGEILRGVEKVK